MVLDEPSNYLDRESLGALSSALSEFGGGVVVISHSKGQAAFCSIFIHSNIIVFISLSAVCADHVP